MPKRLSDASVKNAVKDFVSEARACVEQNLGLAAILTIFSVIFAVVESVIHEDDHEKLFRYFVDQMDDTPSWLLSPKIPKLSNDKIVDLLTEIRNSLAHQCSLPKNVALKNTVKQTSPSKFKYTITLKTFIDEAEKALSQIINDNPQAIFELSPWQSAFTNKTMLQEPVLIIT